LIKLEESAACLVLSNKLSNFIRNGGIRYPHGLHLKLYKLILWKVESIAHVKLQYIASLSYSQDKAPIQYVFVDSVSFTTQYTLFILYLPNTGWDEHV